MKGLYILHIIDNYAPNWYKIGFTEDFDNRYYSYDRCLQPSIEYECVFEIEGSRDQIYWLEQKVLRLTKG